MDTADRNFQRDFEALRLAEEAELTRVFRSCNVDHMVMRTDEPYVETLIRFFRRREKRA